MKRVVALAALSILSLNVAAYADPPSDVKYHEWAAQHAEWVRLHPDRARFFTSHPEMAEKYRHEWSDWHEKANYNEWAEHHPGWVSTHKERHEWFNSHPDAAEKARHEWWEHKETKREYHDWEKAHR